MIGETLNLEAGSLAAVFIPRASTEESEALYKEVSEAVMGTIYPNVVGHLERSQCVKAVHACTTVEQLEQLRFDSVHATMYKELADELNKDERLSDTERMFILIRVSDNMLYAAHEWLNICVRQRANLITSTPPGKRIIDPNDFAKKGKKGLIIT